MLTQKGLDPHLRFRGRPVLAPAGIEFSGVCHNFAFGSSRRTLGDHPSQRTRGSGSRATAVHVDAPEGVLASKPRPVVVADGRPQVPRGSPGRVTIRRQLQRRIGRGLVLVDLKTNKSRRTLDLPAELVDLLRAHRASQAVERLALGTGWADQWGFVLTTPMGTPVDPDNFRHRLGKISERAGLGTWTTHELRHSAGSLLFAMGVPMKVISETLGHSSERVTSEVYVHTMAQHRAQAATAIREALWGASGS